MYSWRDLSKKTHTKDKITRQTSLVVPKKKRVRYPELKSRKHTQYDESQQELQSEYDWDSVYGDWRTWEKKSKQIKEWEDEQ